MLYNIKNSPIITFIISNFGQPISRWFEQTIFNSRQARSYHLYSVYQ